METDTSSKLLVLCVEQKERLLMGCCHRGGQLSSHTVHPDPAWLMPDTRLPPGGTTDKFKKETSLKSYCSSSFFSSQTLTVKKKKDVCLASLKIKSDLDLASLIPSVFSAHVKLGSEQRLCVTHFLMRPARFPLNLPRPLTVKGKRLLPCFTSLRALVRL